MFLSTNIAHSLNKQHFCCVHCSLTSLSVLYSSKKLFSEACAQKCFLKLLHKRGFLKLLHKGVVMCVHGIMAFHFECFGEVWPGACSLLQQSLAGVKAECQPVPSQVFTLISVWKQLQ